MNKNKVYSSLTLLSIEKRIESPVEILQCRTEKARTLGRTYHSHIENKFNKFNSVKLFRWNCWIDFSLIGYQKSSLIVSLKTKSVSTHIMVKLCGVRAALIRKKTPDLITIEYVVSRVIDVRTDWRERDVQAQSKCLSC